MKLIILDRDGVINFDSPDYIKSADEWRPIPNSLEAIAKLNQAGFTVAVASNQSGISRGYYSEETLDLIHQKMHTSLNAFGGVIDGVFYCPHLPDHDCNCRKPKPGLLHKIAEKYQINLNNVPFVGDRCSDVVAASHVGAQAFVVKTAYSDQSTSLAKLDYPYQLYDDLAHVVTAILKSS